MTFSPQKKGKPYSNTPLGLFKQMQKDLGEESRREEEL